MSKIKRAYFPEAYALIDGVQIDTPISKMAQVINASNQNELEAIRGSIKCGWCQFNKKVGNLLCDQCADEDLHLRDYRAGDV